jgi:hypothetical protein
MAADDLDVRRRNFQAAGEKANQAIVGFAIHRGGLQPNLDRICVDTNERNNGGQVKCLGFWSFSLSLKISRPQPAS